MNDVLFTKKKKNDRNADKIFAALYLRVIIIIKKLLYYKRIPCEQCLLYPLNVPFSIFNVKCTTVKVY